MVRINAIMTIVPCDQAHFELLTAGPQMIEVRGMETRLKAIEGKQK
jgi:hypothetical protein